MGPRCDAIVILIVIANKTHAFLRLTIFAQLIICCLWISIMCAGLVDLSIVLTFDKKYEIIDCWDWAAFEFECEDIA